MSQISRRMTSAASTMRPKDSSMRLTDLGHESICLSDDTKHLIAEASRLNVEAEHPKVGAPNPADET